MNNDQINFNESDVTAKKAELIEAINRYGIYRAKPGGQQYLVGKDPNIRYKWQLYPRRVLLNPKYCELACSLLARELEQYGKDVQLAACETGGVTLGYELARQMGLNMFAVRKIRKSYGLLNFCEGIVQQKPVILIDDVAGSTNTLKTADAILKRFNLQSIAYAVLINKTVGTHPENYLTVPLHFVISAHELALTWEQYCEKYNCEPEFIDWC